MTSTSRGRRVAKRVAVATFAGTLAASALAIPAHGQPGTTLGSASKFHKLPAGSKATVVPNRWLVSVEGKPTFTGGSKTKAISTQDTVKRAAASRGLGIKVKRSYTGAWNGFSASADETSIKAVSELPGVTGVFPVLASRIPVTPVASPQLKYAIKMTGANIAQQNGYTGKGIKVGILDTGIDLDHADLGGDGVAGKPKFPNKRVKWGYDFVGDKYDASGETGSTKPVPDRIPDDCNGHGTHVAGIVGAKGKVTGVAPDVQFGAYRIFGCNGSVDTEIIISALEMAGNDRMNVVNMSLGEAFASWPDAPDAVAANNLADRGTIVVDSAGNEGEFGTFSSGTPSVGSKSISVASIENTRTTHRAIKLGSGDVVAYASGDNVRVPLSGTLPLVSAGPDVPAADMPENTSVSGCAAAGAYPVNPSGKAVLVKRGVCTFYEKALKAQQAGAKAVLIYNREDALLTPGLDGPTPITIPVLVISLTDGLKAQAAIAAGKGSVTFTAQTLTQSNPEAGLISTFSSYGLAADLSLKPDVAAPGGNIWSTFPLEKNGYANLSGTSMASPHVAGAVALLLQAHPSLKGNWKGVRDRLQNWSHPALWHWDPGLGILDSAHVQGAGLININDTINLKQAVFPGKLSLGEGEEGPVTKRLSLRNYSTKAVTYTLTNETAVGTRAPNGNPGYDALDAVVSMPQRVRVPARSSTSFTVTIAQPADAPNGYIYNGYLTFTNGDAVMHVPYAGMAGDYQKEKVLTNAVDGTKLPALGRLVDDTVTPVYPRPTAVTSFTGKNGDVPYLMFHLDYPVTNLYVNVYEANSDGSEGKYLGNYFTLGKYGRDDSYLTLPWDGTYLVQSAGELRSKKVALNTHYVLKIRVLKPLGDESNNDHWETFTSTPVQLTGYPDQS